MTNKEVELTLRTLLVDFSKAQTKFNRGIWNDNETMTAIAELITDTAKNIDQLYNEDKTP